MKFMRYGGLSPVRQTHYDSKMERYHAPPARKGLYAFPFPFGVNHYIIPIVRYKDKGRVHLPDYVKYVRDENDNILTYDYDMRMGEKDNPYENINAFPIDLWYEYDDEGRHPKSYDRENFHKGVYVERQKPKIFTHNGLIWHHLRDYVKVDRKDILDEKGSWILSRMSAYVRYFKFAKNLYLSKEYKDGKFRPTICDDYFEVFIEKIK